MFAHVSPDLSNEEEMIISIDVSGSTDLVKTDAMDNNKWFITFDGIPCEPVTVEDIVFDTDGVTPLSANVKCTLGKRPNLLDEPD